MRPAFIVGTLVGMLAVAGGKNKGSFFDAAMSFAATRFSYLRRIAG